MPQDLARDQITEDHHDQDQIIKTFVGVDGYAQEIGHGDARNSVRAARQLFLVDQDNIDHLAQADRHDRKVMRADFERRQTDQRSNKTGGDDRRRQGQPE